MKYALIENGIVKEIVDQTFPFFETGNIFFKEYDETSVTVVMGSKYEDEVFSPRYSLNELKEEKHSERQSITFYK